MFKICKALFIVGRPIGSGLVSRLLATGENRAQAQLLQVAVATRIANSRKSLSSDCVICNCLYNKRPKGEIMKKTQPGQALVLILIFGYVLSASCQSEPIITDFHPFTTLAWTNQQTNTYCDIEWLCNLNHEWVPSGLNLQATQAIISVDIDVFKPLFEQVQWLFRNSLDGSCAGLYFRIVSSEQPIQARFFTNTL